MSRTENSIINVFAAVSGQGIGILISFITRIIFVQKLGEVYLGVNSLFTNIVGLLALAELGVGTAINYSLYKPLAEKNIEKIKALMYLYKRVYITIGVIILVAGGILTPFIEIFMKASDTQSVTNVQFLFVLFVINSSISYFYSYKRALIISDQYRYIATIYRYVFYCLMNVAQIIILLATKNFVFYLIAMIIATALENIFVSKKADTMYPFLKDKNIQKLEKNDLDEIKKNTIALLFHKIGSSVVNSTDNILISRIIGIVTVGIYSNYLLITNALNIVIGQFFNALVASVGNLGATENSDKGQEILQELFYINFIVASIISASIFSSVNLLIEAWFGQKMVLPLGVLIVIVINFYLYQIRRAVLTFRDAYGLYWYDRYKALAEAAINLLVSVILGIKIGLIGIFIGTIVSCIATSLWIEPFILFKHAFATTANKYFIRLFYYTGITFFDCLLSFFVVSRLPISGFAGFIIGVIVTVGIACILNLLTTIKMPELRKFINIMKKIFNMIFEKVRGNKNA